ncbi:MAG: sigma-70 family RNA polymerase sigma factor [Alphaproteobacteria bacterium]|nr:sigma-70 family RNA polymerase sigma factor [Alphaproteobacteria bacterium]
MVAVSLAWSGAVAGVVPAGLARVGPRGDGALKLDEQTIGLLIETVARDQDRDAFAALFRHFAPRLRALGIRGGATPDSAEELAQETMIAVWRKAALYDQRQASGSTWIFTIMRNKRIDLFRAERRPETAPEEMGLAVADGHDVEKAASANEAAAELRRRLAALPHEQSAVLRKAYLEDKTHDAIARELQIPLGTVKSRIRLAIERLRTSMAGMN